MKEWDIAVRCTLLVYGVRAESLEEALDKGLARAQSLRAIMPSGVYIDIPEGPDNPGALRWYPCEEAAMAVKEGQ